MEQKNSARQRLKRAYSDLNGDSKIPDSAASSIVLKALLVTTTIVIGGLFVLMLLSYSLAGNHHILARVIAGGIAFIYLVGANILHHRKQRYLTSTLLVGLYLFISVASIWAWGINVPFALLMMSIAVTLSGILLGAHFSLIMAAVISFFMLTIELLNSLGIYSPSVSWQVGAQPKLGEALGYCLLIGMLALVSWLFGRQIERSLNQAHVAEKALSDEKKLLAIRLEKRTQELRAVQLKEMQQLYRFAELGQMSTALVHDVANHLSVLTLDIEDLKKQAHSDAIEQAVESAYQSISYLDDLVQEVRGQLQDEEHPREFNVHEEIKAVIDHLHDYFQKTQITPYVVTEGNNSNMKVTGDPMRFGQIITILVKNALEAMNVSQSSDDLRSVTVSIKAAKKKIVIDVSDWGAGVPAGCGKKIFQPFYGTKKNGMGIGLFITKTVVETHFKGSIELIGPKKPTTFRITLPRQARIR